MKNLLVAIAGILTLSFFSACKKEVDATPGPTENCRVLSTAVTGGTTYTTDYTYDNKGFISSEITYLYGSTFEIKFSRDNNGRLLSSKAYYNRGLSSSEEYIYTNERITKVQIFDTSHNPVGVHNIKYSAAGDIIEFTNEYGDPMFDGKTLFEYNADRVLTKYTQTDLAGTVLNYVIIKPMGATSKASEIYLIEHGLPYQMIFGYAFSVTEPGVGTTIESYYPNAAGTIVLQETSTIKSTKTNSRGYESETLYADAAGNIVTTIRYAFDGCN